MGFTRFVEVGRVVLINYGPDAGSLAVVVNLVDTQRVLIDGPQDATGVSRQIINMKRIALTDIVLEGIERDCDSKTLSAAYTSQGIASKWNSTTWAKKLKAKKARAATSDFDRFKVMIAKKQRSKLIKEKL